MTGSLLSKGGLLERSANKGHRVVGGTATWEHTQCSLCVVVTVARCSGALKGGDIMDVQAATDVS